MASSSPQTRGALFRALPPAQGLYDPGAEKDACGVAFVATLTGEPSHQIVVQALTALRNMEHRGASGAEVDSGDGAGILLQIPDAFLRGAVDFELPARGGYAVGLAFIPDADEAEAASPRRRRAASPPRRASTCSAGARCRSTPSRSAPPPAA